MADSDSEEALGLFEEPEGYYKPEVKSTEVQHQTIDGQTLRLHLVGQSPLWVGGKSGCNSLRASIETSVI